MGHRNEELLRAGYAAFARGDLDAVFELFSPDIEWHVPGEFPLAGDYKGTEEVRRFFGRLFELLGADGSLQLEPKDILANDEHAVSLMHYQGRRGERTLDTTIVHVWRVDDGQLAEYRAYPKDLHIVEDFWS